MRGSALWLFDTSSTGIFMVRYQTEHLQTLYVDGADQRVIVISFTQQASFGTIAIL